MAHTLGFRCDEVNTSRIWSRWQAVTEEFAQPVTPAMTVAGTCTADQMVPGLGRSSTPLFATPSCYRGHRLLLLWYMRASLRLQQHSPEVHKWVREVKCHMGETWRLVGIRVHAAAAAWVP